MELRIENLTYSYGRNLALKEINLELSPGLISLIGPNGSGKSTLLKCVAGVLEPKGKIYFDGKRVDHGNRTFFGEHIGYMPQQLNTFADFTVFELVLLGLTGSLSLRVGKEQLDLVMATLQEMHIAHLSKKYLYELSGGQQQIVAVAQAIIKDPSILILDEPLNNLDLPHQFEVLETVQRLSQLKNIIVLTSLHDLNLVARYSDRVIVLQNGRIHSDGAPRGVITTEMIQNVYKINAEIVNYKNNMFVHPMGLLEEVV